MGLYVESPLPTLPQNNNKMLIDSHKEKVWVALGDRHLFIREAHIQREIIFRLATRSILKVFRTTGIAGDRTQPEVNKQWIGTFPLPHKNHFRKGKNLRLTTPPKDQEEYKDLVTFAPDSSNKA